VLGKDRLEDLDLFARVQLARVIQICRDSRSLSDAGRKLFSVSRGRKAITNVIFCQLELRLGDRQSEAICNHSIPKRFKYFLNLSASDLLPFPRP
jgi:hypothetical protein